MLIYIPLNRFTEKKNTFIVTHFRTMKNDRQIVKMNRIEHTLIRMETGNDLLYTLWSIICKSNKNVLFKFHSHHFKYI